jgi:CheY-like chemotaxis protein
VLLGLASQRKWRLHALCPDTPRRNWDNKQVNHANNRILFMSKRIFRRDGLAKVHLSPGRQARIVRRTTRAPRIVVVDDAHPVLELIQKCIHDWRSNAIVTVFDSGTKAWEHLLQSEPDLLISDMCRPYISGYDMLPLLADKTAGYPILIVSGQATEEDVRELAGSDLNVSFLAKPFTSDEFQLQLRQLLGCGGKRQ